MHMTTITKTMRAGLVAGLALGAMGLGLPQAADAANYDIHVVLPLTGSAAFVGQGQKDVLTALEDDVNNAGGISGETLHFVFEDDQTSPQVAVQLTTDLLASHPAVVMGSSLVGMCLAMAPLVADGPLHYCLSPAIHPKPGSYVFSTGPSSIDQIAAVIQESLGILRKRFAADDKAEGYRKDGPVSVARFELGEGDEPEQREARLLRQRQVSDVVEQLLARIG
jgi:branched-chain amino acid transport system substrate-binding protein